MLRTLLVSFSLLCIHQLLSAQDTVYLTKALQRDNGYRYGREPVYTDTVAFQMYSGESPSKTGDWKPVEADSLHQFEASEFTRSRYLYLTYVSPRETTALLNVKGSVGIVFNSVLHTGDPYGTGYFYIPVKIKKGINELYIRPRDLITARLIFNSPAVSLNVQDPTLPSVKTENPNNLLYGAVVVINNTDRPLKKARIQSGFSGNSLVTDLPEIPAMSIRKVPFKINASAHGAKGRYPCTLKLFNDRPVADEKVIQLQVTEAGDRYDTTFFSDIDGSLQYYAVTPQTTAPQAGAALFLSIHGAGVEANAQAAAYERKSWGTLVAATNRRPFGFDWEDWGRLDALEVLALAKKRFQPDEKQIYLTGHSMGGHGTWYLGSTYPDQWAAIAACSGYPSLRDYGASFDKTKRDSSRSVPEISMRQAANPGNVFKLVSNYKPLGVYILHGSADEVVSVKYARQMRELLGTFQSDFSYYEYPGGAHWFGNQSVDWHPIFEYFRWHERKPDSVVSDIDFKTASPGISASDHWAAVQQQIRPLDYSHIVLHRDLKKLSINGSTENVRTLSIALHDFGSQTAVRLQIDSLSVLNYTTQSTADTVYLIRSAVGWAVGQRPREQEKSPARYGTFKEAFKHRMVFVYGTLGSPEERDWAFNKARFDAETWYYRGNGAVDMIADKDYHPERFAGRSVILYGNASTNAAWDLLLKNSPIQVKRNELRIGDEVIHRNDLAAYFVRPLPGGNASVAVITGTGISGMQAANSNQYYSGGSGFPDYVIFGLDMLRTGVQGVLKAGFFDNEWKLTSHE